MQEPLSFPLAHALSSPSIARMHAREFVTPWASPALREDLTLLVSELVTNAVLHGLPNIHVNLCLAAACHVRVEVFDGSRDLPEMRPTTADSISGRGLQLLDALAHDWGTQPQPDGKVVWFELLAKLHGA